MVSRMTILVEKETDDEIGFDYEEILGKVIIKAIELEKCPYQCEVSVTFTDDNGIRELNRDFRNLDVPTDVLSFPMADYSPPADFSILGEDEAAAMYFNPESGELLLGDIIISLLFNTFFENAKNFSSFLSSGTISLPCTFTIIFIFGFFLLISNIGIDECDI